MGIWRDIFGLGEVVSSVVEDSAPAFATSGEDLVGGADIDPAVFGLESFATSTAPAPRIDRRSAMQVGAVKRSRDLIAGTLGGLPLQQYGPDKIPVDNPLFEQPERSVAQSVTMTRTVEDMLFEGIAWWRITESTWDGWPVSVKRLRPGRVTVDEDRDKVYVDGRETDQSTLIRFDSPSDPLLVAGARAIRTFLALDAYTSNAAKGIPPLDFFTPADDAGDPFDDEDDESIEEPYTQKNFLDDWQEARRLRTTAYIPAAVKYQMVGFDPKALQLAEQKREAVLEIARHGGVDAEELGVSTTSRTYSNQFDRRKNFTDFTIGQYRQSFEDRLRMRDVTPRGHYVKFTLDAFMRSDPEARYRAYRAGLDVGALTEEEIRDLEDKPQLTAAQKTARRQSTPALPAPDPAAVPAAVPPLRSVQ